MEKWVNRGVTKHTRKRRWTRGWEQGKGDENARHVVRNRAELGLELVVDYEDCELGTRGFTFGLGQGE